MWQLFDRYRGRKVLPSARQMNLIAGILNHVTAGTGIALTLPQSPSTDSPFVISVDTEWLAEFVTANWGGGEGPAEPVVGDYWERILDGTGLLFNTYGTLSHVSIGTAAGTVAAGDHTHDYSNTYAAKTHTHDGYAETSHTHAPNQIIGLALPDAATATPQKDGTGSVGNSLKYARENHVHPLNVSSSAPVKADGTTGAAGSSSAYARSDHKHPVNDITELTCSIDGHSGNCLLVAEGSEITHSGNDMYNAVERLARGVIEFKPAASATHGGYIDFHFAGDSSDYSSRIIEVASGTVEIISPAHARLSVHPADTTAGSDSTAGIARQIATVGFCNQKYWRKETGATGLLFNSNGTLSHVSIGTTAGTVAAGNHTHAASSITGLTLPSAATATPLKDGMGAVGNSAKYARENHVHPLNVSTDSPQKADDTTGDAGSSSAYARSDHKHPVNDITELTCSIDGHSGNCLLVAEENEITHSGNDMYDAVERLSRGVIELKPADTATHGGYIDFHYAGSTADWTSRIIEDSSGRVTIRGNQGTSPALSLTNTAYESRISFRYGGTEYAYISTMNYGLSGVVTTIQSQGQVVISGARVSLKRDSGGYVICDDHPTPTDEGLTDTVTAHQVATVGYVNEKAGGAPQNPTSYTDLSVSGEGGVAARTNSWTYDGAKGVKVTEQTRTYYDHTATTPVLYGYYRTKTYDKSGRLYSVSAETRYVIDQPVVGNLTS